MLCNAELYPNSAFSLLPYIRPVSMVLLETRARLTIFCLHDDDRTQDWSAVLLLVTPLNAVDRLTTFLQHRQPPPPPPPAEEFSSPELTFYVDSYLVSVMFAFWSSSQSDRMWPE